MCKPGFRYRYNMDNKTPPHTLSDSLSVQNLSVQSLLSIHCRDNEARTWATSALIKRPSVYVQITTPRECADYESLPTANFINILRVHFS